MMKVKFANGVIKKCKALTEHKMYKKFGDETVGVSWLLTLFLKGTMTSTELDEILTKDNIASLEFMTEVDNEGDKHLYTLEGYDTVTFSSIRYSDDINEIITEIQLTKGV